MRDLRCVMINLESGNRGAGQQRDESRGAPQRESRRRLRTVFVRGNSRWARGSI